ncbi:hypothetical protein ACERK3_09565 [Phycisphaerales bacterium AB-hyl4]|uniref:Uncharacterized protein n=1 Tax=Natronomicrosphaera hydrolytica TaxID=3242702 RepID=A0ABV4U4M0_9BACT
MKRIPVHIVGRLARARRRAFDVGRATPDEQHSPETRAADWWWSGWYRAWLKRLGTDRREQPADRDAA